jgi:dihydropteroate synthase
MHEPSCLPFANRYPTRATVWQLRTRELTFGRLPLLMGIVNVTPDSFSDGGRFLAAERAVEHGLRLAEQGAAILDIGGESTRPYATPVERDEELRRIAPVVETLCRQTAIPVSIDTSKAEVALAAIEAGAEIVNDITGLEGDPRMLAVVREAGVGVCAMHMRGTPQTMQDDPRYEHVVRDIGHYLEDRRDALLAAGIDQRRICLDPGIGFGKTHAHNLELMSHCGEYHRVGCPLLIGHSRKGFIGKVLGNAEVDRTLGNAGAALAVALQGIQVIRVHDVQAVRQALLLFEACGGLDCR